MGGLSLFSMNTQMILADSAVLMGLSIKQINQNIIITGVTLNKEGGLMKSMLGL